MFYLVVQTVLLMAVAFILGAIIGCLLRRLVGATVDDTVGDERGDAVPATAVAATPAATAPHRPQPRLVPQPLQRVDADAPHAEPGAVPETASAAATAETVEGRGFGGAGGVGSGGVAAGTDDGARDATRDAAPSRSRDAAGGSRARTASGPISPSPSSPSPSSPSPSSPAPGSPTGDLSGAAGLVGATGVPGPARDEDAGSRGKPEGVAGADAGAKGATGDRTAVSGERRSDDAEPAPAPGLVGGGATDVPDVPDASVVAGERDNLKLIRGVGPRNEGRLNDIGVFRFEQIAAWTRRQQREIGEELSFPGRIERENWVAQAKTLAAGRSTEFSKRADAGRVRTSTGEATPERGAKPPVLEAARDGKPDNLTLIDGVGNAIERKLFRLGIYHFDQVAAWSDEETVWVGDRIGFPGRAERENWREEARVLGEGGTTDHAERVERGQIKTSRKSTDEER